MTRPIKKARVTRRRKYYGGGKKGGATTLKKVGGSGDVAPKQEVNEYATWAVALRSLILSQNSDYDDLVIARNKEGEEITLKKWKDNIQTSEDFQRRGRLEDLNIKNYDLGGGDQKKFKNFIKEKEDGNKTEDWLKEQISGIEKGYFLTQKGTLITGGTGATRKASLKEFIDKGILEPDSYALIPGMETKLTAISYYDKACELLNDPQLKTLCLITVGSTDAHIITYTKNEKNEGEEVSVEHETYCEFATAKDPAGIPIPIQLKQCDKYIFAGSGPYYIDTPNGWADREDDWTNILKAPDKDIKRDEFENNFESYKNMHYWEHGVMVNSNNKKVKEFKTLLKNIQPSTIIFRHYENADRDKTHEIIEIPNIFNQNDGYNPVGMSESTPKLGGKLSRRRKTDKKKNKRVTKKSRKSRKSGK